MTRFIVMRHAQSEANMAQFFSGATDVSLTEIGHKQAMCTAKLLYDTWKMPIDVAYTSHWRRVKKTAKYVCDMYGLTPIIDEELREITGGEWEGRPHKTLNEEGSVNRNLWNNDFARAGCPGGESVQELAQRIKKAFTKIAERHDGQNVFVATHAVPLIALITMCKGLSFDEIKTEYAPTNASITIIEWYGIDEYKIIKQSYDEHLTEACLQHGLA